MGKIIEVKPRAGAVAKTEPLWQYDSGQIIRVTGITLPATYKAEFSNSTRGNAVPTVQTTDEIAVPAQFLQSGNPVYIWLVVVDEQSRTTEYALNVPVAARAKPTDTEPTPEEQSEIDQALAALNSGVSRVEGIADAIPDTINDALEAAKESGEFDGQDGISPTVTITEITGGHRITIIDEAHPNGQVVDVLDGTNGRGIVSVEKTGTSGLTDTYTITYTSGDPTTFTVVNGKDGQDAISPEITVASITGGHRITITDTNGTHTVDVLDGKIGDAGRGIVSVQKTGTAGLVDTYTITYTDSTTSTFTVTNGKNGTDGISPSITITDITGGHRVTITDADGQHSFDVMNGEDGQGIPAGGTAGQVLEKTSGADYAVSWADKNPVVQVSGTTPSITALPGIQYICGEVATLDITLPASGCVGVVFTSGSTATVLTIATPTGQTVRWANGFDPTALDADTTYEINIMDGLGVAGAWS